jgi:hypothetical protein
MIWGGSGAAVPAVHLFSLLLLGAALALTGRAMIQKGGWARVSALLGLGLLVITVPVAVFALSLPHTFTNGTVADAGQVNSNFTSLATAIDSDRARLTALESQSFGRVYVGTTTVTGSMASLGSYVGADARCQAAFPGSFVCSTQEILESNRRGLLPTSGGISINSGVAGISPPNVADCNAWSGEGYRVGVNFSGGPRFVYSQNGCTTGLSFPLGCCK